MLVSARVLSSIIGSNRQTADWSLHTPHCYSATFTCVSLPPARARHRVCKDFGLIDQLISREFQHLRVEEHKGTNVKPDRLNVSQAQVNSVMYDVLISGMRYVPDKQAFRSV